MPETTPIYDDEYTGPRWRYGLTYRPLSAMGGWVKGWIVFSDRPHPGYRFGTVDWPRPLTAHEATQADLTLVETLDGQA